MKAAPKQKSISTFKDLNTVYTEEINRDEGYWSSTSSSSDESEHEAQGKKGEKKRIRPATKSKAAVVDFRIDTKEKARQEWLWATGQLGVEPHEERRKPEVSAAGPSLAKKEPATKTDSQSTSLVLPRNGASVNATTISEVPKLGPPENVPVSANQRTSTSPEEQVVHTSILESRKEISPMSGPSISPRIPDPSGGGRSGDNAYHSLAYFEQAEFEKAQEEWIASNFEKPFNAEHEMKEAKKRAAERFYQQQRTIGSISHHLVDDSDTHANTVGHMPDPSSTVLKHMANSTHSIEQNASRHQMFMACAESLEKLVQSDFFVMKVQRFLQKHHRSLLSTKVMRDNGEYCHEDHAVFRAYVTEMEGCIMKALHEGATQYVEGERRRRRLAAKASRTDLSRQGRGVERVTASGVGVVVRIDSDADFAADNSDAEGDIENDPSKTNPLLEFDEEEFFDFLFSTNDQEDSSGTGRGDALSFEAWEALLSVLHFNSFIDLVDEFVAAEYGLDEMDTREDTKTARKRGLPSSSQASGTPPPSPVEPSIASVGYSSVKTPHRQPTQPSVTTPSPPKVGLGTLAAGSGAAMRKLLPTNSSSGTAKAFVSSVTNNSSTSRSSSSTGARSNTTQQRLGKPSGDTYSTRAPGSAPQPGKSGTRSQSNTARKAI